MFHFCQTVYHYLLETFLFLCALVYHPFTKGEGKFQDHAVPSHSGLLVAVSRRPGTVPGTE